MKKVNYKQFLTPENKLDTSFAKNHGKILSFSVNYSALINNRWRYIMRIDNCHGKPHRHRYYLQRKQFKVLLSSDNNTAFTQSKEYIIKNFEKIRENYLKVRGRKINI